MGRSRKKTPPPQRIGTPFDRKIEKRNEKNTFMSWNELGWDAGQRWFRIHTVPGRRPVGVSLERNSVEAVVPLFLSYSKNPAFYGSSTEDSFHRCLTFLSRRFYSCEWIDLIPSVMLRGAIPAKWWPRLIFTGINILANLFISWLVTSDEGFFLKQWWRFEINSVFLAIQRACPIARNVGSVPVVTQKIVFTISLYGWQNSRSWYFWFNNPNWTFSLQRG